MEKTNYERYLWTSIWLGLGVFLGLVFIICFAVADGANVGFLFLWAMAYLAIGGLVGFIFSVPKILSDSAPPATTAAVPAAVVPVAAVVPAAAAVPAVAAVVPAAVPDAQAVPAAAVVVPPVDPAAGAQGNQTTSTPAPTPMSTIGKARAQENTNLTQISDWLTKILIGAGLVEIKQVPGFVHHIAIVMAGGLCCKVAGASSAMPMICAAIILYFVTWGFICGYLVMKLVLTEQFLSADS